jgi:hypothetical protein
VTPTILGRLHEIRTVGIASFGVLVLPPSTGLAGWIVDHCSFHSKTPSGTGAHVEAFAESSLVTTMLAQGTCCRDLEVFLQLLHMEQVGGQLWIMVATLSLDLLDD